MGKRTKSYRRRKGPTQPPKRKFGPLYRVPFRRRRELKTDYHQRKRLLKSGKIRFVTRPSNKHVLVQFVQSNVGGDRTLIQTRSSELSKYGWDIATSNLPAAYLTGYLAGKKALKANINEAILDIGLFSPQPGTRIFATLKGALDAGVTIPCRDKMFPSEDRIRGEHIKNYALILAEENKEKYEYHFAKYLEVNKKPEAVPDYFEKTKAKIDSDFK
ncbi:MAG: 50S ribosomal protein L18 [Candidatus Heimdallarchaeaceae archaeon]